ncbi:hypothetical protein [Dysgonomonas sp. 216]|uniref:hypothetical protein n=1 Tax=Dysgonomonas sp. 216 TaxID=2302934 RepID=UPI0013D234DD|nr:hypothetical protein [Dysgonomonas sp. 216]
MSSKKNSFSKIFKSNLLAPLIGIVICVIYYGYNIDSKNIVRNQTINCSMQDVPENNLQAICWMRSTILVDDAAGNRYSIEKGQLNCNDNIDKLKAFNYHFERFIKMDSPETLFQDMTINEIVEKHGDYIYANTASGEYSFPQIYLVSGSKRYQGLTVYVGADNKVSGIRYGDESSNWFGSLPFYADIVSLNLFPSFSGGILQSKEDPGSSNIFMILLETVWNLIKLVLVLILYFIFVIAVVIVPLFIVLPVFRFMSGKELISNKIINTLVVIVGAVISYIIIVALTDCSRSLWLLTFPIGIAAAVMTIISFMAAVTHDRCPKCNKEKALLHERVYVSTEKYPERIQDYKKRDKRYGGIKNGYKIYYRDIDYWITEREVTRKKYLATDHCKFCTYTYKYDSYDTEKGPGTIIEEWTRTQTIRQALPEPEPYQRYSSNEIKDENNGAMYDKVDGSDYGGEYIEYQGERYRKRR